MMQTADCTLETTSRFSWDRVKAVAAFYYPLLRPQIILYPIVALALFIVATAATAIQWTDLFWAAPATVISIMSYFAPAILARRDSRMVEMLLPATALEKTVVLGVYFFIAVPLMTYGVYYLIGGLIELLLPFVTVIGKLKAMRVEMGASTLIYQVSEMVPVVTCLWVVMAVKRSRMLKSVLYTILSVISMGVIGMVWGLIMAFKSGFIQKVKEIASNSAINHDAMTPEQIQEIGATLAPDMSAFLLWCGILSIVYIIFAVYMTYRTIKTRQV